MSYLVLDSAIRDWVLIPIVVVLLLVSLLRKNILAMLQSENIPDLKDVQLSESIKRAVLLRNRGKVLTSNSFEKKVSFFADEKQGLFKPAKKDPASEQETPDTPMGILSQDPSKMLDSMDGMKKNMLMFLPQILLISWVNFFFSGFVLVKLPFPLTMGFRDMLQRGMESLSLDISYVSSLSWYFLSLFGLQGIEDFLFSGFIPKPKASSAVPKLTTKQVEAERENLIVAVHDSSLLEQAEERLLKCW